MNTVTKHFITLGKKGLLISWLTATFLAILNWFIAEKPGSLISFELLVYCIIVSYVIFFHVLLSLSLFSIITQRYGVIVDKQRKRLIYTGIFVVGFMIGVLDSPYLLQLFSKRLVLPSLANIPFNFWNVLVGIACGAWLVIAVIQITRETFQHLTRSSTIKTMQLWKKLVIVGALLFAANLFLINYKIFENADLKFAELLTTLYQSTNGEGGHLKKKGHNNDVEIVTLYMGENKNSDVYLQSCLMIARELKRLGARALLIGSPELVKTEKNEQLITDIHNTGIVVFGKYPISSPFTNKKRAPTHPYRGKAPVLWGVYTSRIEQVTQRPEPRIPSVINRITPVFERYGSQEYVDISIQLLKKYKGYPDSEPIIMKRGNLTLGEISIPLLDDGSFMTPNLNYPYYMWFFAGHGIYSDSLRYYAYENNVGYAAFDTLDAFRSSIENKIILLSTGDLEYGGQSLATMYTYANILRSVLSNAVIRKNSIIHIAITLLMISAFVFLTIKLRPGATVGFLLAAIVALAVFQVWTYYEYQLLLDFHYPLISALLMLGMFPSVRLSHDRTIAFMEKQRLEKEEKRKLLEELQAAHSMQMNLMPVSDPVVHGFDISGICKPAEEVGGDYFDYVWLDTAKTKFGVAIADVSGKAMKAAMTAVMTSGMVYREVGSDQSPKMILQKINKPMYLKTDKHIFTAMSFAMIDIQTKLLTFSNAGQMQPILLRKNELQFITVKGVHLPLGIKEEIEYQEAEFQLQTGDVLYFYTDGITEAMNEKKEAYGFERFESFVRSRKADEAGKIKEALFNEIKAFTGDAKQHDDMTLVVVRVL